jgi:hypothetical protein
MVARPRLPVRVNLPPDHASGPPRGATMSRLIAPLGFTLAAFWVAYLFFLVSH